MRTRCRRLSFVVVLILFTTVLRGADWTELRTNDVVIYSDARAKDVVEFAVGYSAFRHAIRGMFPRVQHPLPARVLLFRSLGSLQKCIPESSRTDTQTVAYTTVVDGDALIAVAVDGDRSEALRRTFEFDTIWQLGRAGYFLPVWMSQGAGEVLSSLEVRKTGYRIGDDPGAALSGWRESGNLSWRKFFDVNTGSAEYAGEKATGAVHAKAWALMHRILLQSDDGSQKFESIAGKLQTMTGLEAVTTSLGLTEDNLDADIRAHFRRNDTVRDVPFDVAGLRRSLQPRPAPEAEVHVQLANLLYSAGNLQRARGELEKAETLAPTSASLKEARARWAMNDGQPDEAARLYREAIEAGTTNAMAYLFSARRRLDESSLGSTDRAGGGGPEVVRAAEEVRKAIELNPGSSYAYRMLGRVFFLMTEIGPAQIEELSRGIGFDSSAAEVRYYRALLYWRLKQRADYAADLRQIVNDPAAPARLKDQAAERLDDEEAEVVEGEVKSLVSSRDFERAHALLTQKLAANPGRRAAEHLQRLLLWVDENDAWLRLRESARAGNWREVSEKGKQFLDRFPKSSVVPSVRRILNDAERAQANSTKAEA